MLQKVVNLSDISFIEFERNNEKFASPILCCNFLAELNTRKRSLSAN